MSEPFIHPEQEQLDVERESALRVLHYAEDEMRKTAPVLMRILQARHELFDMDTSEINSDEPVEEQLYADNFYNDSFIVSDLRVRTGAKYHKEREKYDPIAEDTPELAATKKAFRQHILSGAQQLEFVSKYAGESNDPIDRKFGMLPSTMEYIEQPVEAWVVAGAKFKSLTIRVHDAVRNIESGAVKTDTIILAAGERPVEDHERAEARSFGFQESDTEFEQMIHAFEDIHGATFDDTVEHTPAPYGNAAPDLSVRRGSIVINDKVVNIIAVEGTYDRERRDVMSGELADRAITSETFRAAATYIPEGNGTIVVGSHDTWGKGQEIISQEVFGLEDHKTVIGTWAYKSDRVTSDAEGNLDINLSQGVIDEMAKSHFNLVRLKVAAVNKLDSLSA